MSFNDIDDCVNDSLLRKCGIINIETTISKLNTKSPSLPISNYKSIYLDNPNAYKYRASKHEINQLALQYNMTKL